MAYQPYDRTPKGIVFFGENAADQVYESTSGFVYTSGTSTLDVPNVNVSNNLDVGGSGTFDGDLTVYGNLNVSGVVNQVNLEELLVEDSSITLRSNATGTPSDGDDASIVVNRGASNDVDIRWDEGNDYWSFTNDGTNYHPFVIEGSGLSHRFPASNSDHPILDLDIDDLPIVTSAQDGDYIAIADSSSGNATRKITRSNLLTGFGAGTVTSVGITSDTLTISGSPITSSGDIDLEVKKDGTTIDLNGSNELQIADGGVTEAKRERTVGTYNSTSSITHDIALGSGVIDLTLPPAASGQMVFVKRTDSTTGALTVSASGSQTIDGAGNKALYYQYESINVVSDGNNWFIV
jgi:hypothetical protein